jgi:hypothetical protein
LAARLGPALPSNPSKSPSRFPLGPSARSGTRQSKLHLPFNDTRGGSPGDDWVETATHGVPLPCMGAPAPASLQCSGTPSRSSNCPPPKTSPSWLAACHSQSSVACCCMGPNHHLRFASSCGRVTLAYGNQMLPRSSKADKRHMRLCHSGAAAERLSLPLSISLSPPNMMGFLYHRYPSRFNATANHKHAPDAAAFPSEL